MISIEHTLDKLSSLISLPEIYYKFQKVMDDPKSNIDDFCNVISIDPNLTGTVLKLGNSAYFGFPGRIDNIKRAINLLGISQLYDMVLSISALKSLHLPNEIMPLRKFWCTSLKSAIWAQELGKEMNCPNHESLFVMGLLHEMGHLIMYCKFPEQTKEAYERARNERLPLHVTEQELFGLHYGQVGASIMAQWKLPVHFQSITRCQPTPTAQQAYQFETSIIHLAHYYAHRSQNDKEFTDFNSVDQKVWNILPITPDHIETVISKVNDLSLDVEKNLFG